MKKRKPGRQILSAAPGFTLGRKGGNEAGRGGPLPSLTEPFPPCAFTGRWDLCQQATVLTNAPAFLDSCVQTMNRMAKTYLIDHQT
jgi:hypothetical protein